MYTDRREQNKFESEDVVRAYLIKRDVPHYQRVFQALERRPLPISFSIWGLLFGGQWLFFRRMFGLGTVYVLISAVFSYFITRGDISWIFLLLFQLLWAPCMNCLYKRSIDKKVEKVMEMPYEQRRIFLEKYKGVSWGFFTLTVILIILTYFFMLMNTAQYVKQNGI
ncbi:MAG: DUF2628 domain-containing protein [Peptostreptococcaceae bacterium]|nr:DUF2628 domain-containing protein [Peptostreptococcaceae bacterium]